MKLILNWSKQQWLGMDAYQKSAVNFDRTFLFVSLCNLNLIFGKKNRSLK